MPPSIILEVLRILKAEADLRNLTRVAEQTRQALPREHETESQSLARTQEELRIRTHTLIQRLARMQSEQKKNYGQDLRQLSQAERAMQDAQRLLAASETGSSTIAAETEAIEALLTAKRAQQGKGGSSGRTPGGSTQSGSTDLAASALSGIGEGREARTQTVEQSTGTFTNDFPEEYRAGLDAYFNALEDAGG